MLQMYLVRHGETEATRQSRYEGQGGGDRGLTEEGLRQARRVAQALRGEPVSRVFTSDSRRAVETAEVLSRAFGLVPVLMSDLREVRFGEWEGLTFQEITERYPDLVQQWVADPVRTRPPAGETLLEMSSRVLACLDEIVLQCEPGVVVVVSHGGPIRAALSTYLGRGLGAFWSIAQSPGAVNVVRFEHGRSRVEAPDFA